MSVSCFISYIKCMQFVIMSSLHSNKCLKPLPSWQEHQLIMYICRVQPLSTHHVPSAGCSSLPFSLSKKPLAGDSRFLPASCSWDLWDEKSSKRREEERSKVKRREKHGWYSSSVRERSRPAGRRLTAAQCCTGTQISGKDCPGSACAFALLSQNTRIRARGFLNIRVRNQACPVRVSHLRFMYIVSEMLCWPEDEKQCSRKLLPCSSHTFSEQTFAYSHHTHPQHPAQLR